MDCKCWCCVGKYTNIVISSIAYSYKGEITAVPAGHEFCLPGTTHFCLQDGN